MTQMQDCLNLKHMLFIEYIGIELLKLCNRYILNNLSGLTEF